MINQANIFDNSFNKIERAMQVATMRQEVITQNIANAKTPGYEALTFDEQLMRATKRKEQSAVNLEEEMAALTENSVKYSAYVKLMTSKMNILKTIASQGRR